MLLEALIGVVLVPIRDDTLVLRFLALTGLLLMLRSGLLLLLYLRGKLVLLLPILRLLVRLTGVALRLLLILPEFSSF